MDEKKCQDHLDLLYRVVKAQDDGEINTTPLFTEAVRQAEENTPWSSNKTAFKQYGLLGGDASKLSSKFPESLFPNAVEDPRVYYNIAAPSSTFICGSQGSGKSHTLSCLLENCLIPSQANVLPNPLTGIVFHYDPFFSDAGGSPCEAAYLSSHESANVRVLCPPTNFAQIKRIYSTLPRVTVQELRIGQSDLNTKRMLDLMAISSIQGTGIPLYMHVVLRILRDLRLEQQTSGGSFNYGKFRQALKFADLHQTQLAPLEQRLETLESFMAKEHVVPGGVPTSRRKKNLEVSQHTATSWESKPGQITIVDLSCPCVTAESACALFNICLNLFLEQPSTIGRVVALDEAHKYMTDSAECQTLTESLLSTIRLQRHLGARIIISTQEPTISPRLLDLCSVTIVHRFTSPDWLASLRKHLAGASTFGMNNAGGLMALEEQNDDETGDEHASFAVRDPMAILFSKIVSLRTGEALLFSPSAVIDVKKRPAHDNGKTTDDGEGSDDEARSTDGDGNGFSNHDSESTGSSDGAKSDTEQTGKKVVRLGQGVMKIRIRQRITQDGGQSVMAA